MALASLLFLGASIRQTRSKNVRAWKSSSLALLFCSVDDVKHASAAYPNTYDELPSRISKRRLLLQNEGYEGWAFRRA